MTYSETVARSIVINIADVLTAFAGKCQCQSTSIKKRRISSAETRSKDTSFTVSCYDTNILKML